MTTDGDVVWIAYAPAGVQSSGPVAATSEWYANEYRKMGWDVQGPYVPRDSLTEAERRIADLEKTGQTAVELWSEAERRARELEAALERIINTHGGYPDDYAEIARAALSTDPACPTDQGGERTEC